jgi:hypothetical protein
MKPTINWSALAALFRTLTILGASAFAGAIVLPVSIGGSLPATWAEWRPVLAVALAASVTAEFIWIRGHLAALASSLGIGGTTVQTTSTMTAHTDPPAAKVGQQGYSLLPVLGLLAVLGILVVIALVPRDEHVVVGSAVQEDGTVAFVESPVALEGCSGGVPTAATQAVINASAALALCVEAVVQHDETETPPAPVTTVLVDEGMTCASQAAALVNAVGQEVNPTTTAAQIEKAHAAVMAKRAAAAGH